MLPELIAGLVMFGCIVAVAYIIYGLYFYSYNTHLSETLLAE